MTRRLRAERALALWLAVLPVAARAQGTCVAQTEAWHRSQGLFPAIHTGVMLDVGELRVVTLEGLERCARIDVLGHASLELVADLYDDGGVLLARDAIGSATPSVSTCRVAGTLHLALRAVAGRGHVDVIASVGSALGAPSVAPCAFGTPGVARGETDLGVVTSSAADEVLAAALETEGVRATSSQHVEGTGDARFDVDPGCHLTLLAGGDAETYVVTEGPDGPSRVRLVAGRGVLALACTSAPKLSVHVEGASRVAVALLDATVDRGDVPSDLSEASAARFALEASRARARGLTRDALGVARVGRDALVVPGQLGAGECALVVAATEREPLTLALTDPDGRMHARDVSGASVVHAWHCADTEEATRAWIRLSSTRRARVVYAVFRSRSR